MARPLKRGLDYFPLDVHFENDDRLVLLHARFGLAGIGLLVTILQHIYGQGYWCNWGEDELHLFSRNKARCESKDVSDLVEFLLGKEFFDPGMFKEYGILTSTGIQRRYFEAVKRREDPGIKQEYLLIETNWKEKPPPTPPPPEPEQDDETPVSAIVEDDVEIHGIRKIREWLNDHWNRLADADHKDGNKVGLVKIRSWNDYRKSQLKVRLKEDLFSGSLLELVGRIESSDFLRGKTARTGKHGSWRASIDWLLENNKNYLKILEGKYGGKVELKATPKHFENSDFTRGQRYPDDID